MNTLQSEIRRYAPAIVLDSLLPRTQRRILIRFLGVALFFLGGIVVGYIGYDSVRAHTLDVSSLEGDARYFAGVFLILFGPYAALLQLSFFYNTLYFRGLQVILREELTDEEGITQEVAAVCDAFAPTCAPCAKKVPALLAQKGALGEAGATLVLVAVLADGESDADAAAALAKWGAVSPFLVDRGDVLRRELAIDALPGTVVLDASGKVRWVAAPEASADDVVAAARAAASEGDSGSRSLSLPLLQEAAIGNSPRTRRVRAESGGGVSRASRRGVCFRPLG